jgi:hypothetical protein
MTNRDFVIWMRGFVVACHEYAPTPKQWDDIKDQLNHVTDNDSMWDIESNEALFKAAKKYKSFTPTPEPSKVF